MGKHRNLPQQRPIFTWQHCRNLQQQGGSVRPSWATAFRVEKTALLLKITTESENPEMVENPRKMRKQAKQTNNREIKPQGKTDGKAKMAERKKPEKRDKTQKKSGQKKAVN